MLTNHCLLAKIGFATAENGPSRVILRNCKSLAGSTGTSFQRERQRNLLIVHAKLDRFEQNWLCLFASAQLADSERSQGKTAFFEEKCLTNFSATLSDLGILFIQADNSMGSPDVDTAEKIQQHFGMPPATAGTHGIPSDPTKSVIHLK